MDKVLKPTYATIIEGFENILAYKTDRYKTPGCEPGVLARIILWYINPRLLLFHLYRRKILHQRAASQKAIAFSVTLAGVLSAKAILSRFSTV
jgi:hypothetical protein